jgi:FAD/FMN-containing dehydrogenase
MYTRVSCRTATCRGFDQVAWVLSQANDPALHRLVERIAAARARRTPLDIRGGGTKSFYGEAPCGEPLSLAELTGIRSYDPSELVATVRAGTPLAELEAALEERGQCLAFEPPRFAARGTVGGMVAAGLAGPARCSVGGVRDFVLGATVMNGRGELLTFGGQVMKNVAGYDVARVFAGSLGILGVICEVSLKVLPTAPATATLRLDCGEAEALALLRRLAARPLPLNASAWHDGRLHLRLRGARAAVVAAIATLGGRAIADDAAQRWWHSLRDHRHEFFAHSDGDLERGGCLWRVSVPGTAAPLQLPGRQFIEWSGAQRWWRTRADAALIRAEAARAGGHATLMRGTDKSAGVFTPVGDALMGIHRRLKAAFDPERIFNPGRLYPDL